MVETNESLNSNKASTVSATSTNQKQHQQMPVTYEGQYVAQTVGLALSKGLIEIIEKRPVDPVEYLSNFLYKFVENKNQQEKVIRVFVLNLLYLR